ncbi:hypothetical protein HJC23_004161 [Cyclotella cryptica]|uniref:Uncharacterized protein n=1 Tax=Cyclotella cryptica TaxID=29204 RepID=A0ABD3NYZ4_9STRA
MYRQFIPPVFLLSKIHRRKHDSIHQGIGQASSWDTYSPSRYLTLRIEFTESIATSDLPEAWKDKNHHYSSQSKKCVSPIPAKAGFVITPLGTVAEENCTGLSVAMTAYSKGRMGGDADCVEQPLSQQSRLESTSSQFEIDELVLEAEEEQEEEEEEEGFKPFTQMDFQHQEEEVDSKSTEVDRNNRHKNKAAKRTQSEVDNSSPTNHSRCVTPNESNHLPPGTKIFGIPYGNNGSQAYLKCIVRDHRLNPMGEEQYKVEFVQVSGLEKKKQWIPVRKVMRPSEMRKRIESALDKLDGDCLEEMIQSVAEEIGVCPSFVRTVFHRR